MNYVSYQQAVDTDVDSEIPVKFSPHDVGSCVDYDREIDTKNFRNSHAFKTAIPKLLGSDLPTGF